MADLFRRVGGLGRSPIPGDISGATNVWSNVTPADMILDNNDAGIAARAGAGSNFGCQGVRLDPANYGVMYTSATYQKLWKSTDFGLTWNPVTISGLDPFFNARPNLNIACDGSYMITTALYNAGGGVQNGCWRATPPFTSWTRYNIGFDNGDDAGRMNVCPFTATINGVAGRDRIVASAHSGTDHMWESKDGGLTWTDQGAQSATPEAEYFWVDQDTLLAIPDSSGAAHTYRGVRSGNSWPWTWTWTDVDTQQHYHGTCQPYMDPSSGSIWTGGNANIRKSTDAGATWSQVDSHIGSGILATSKTLFSTQQFATGGTNGPWLLHASLPAGTSWTLDTEPSGFTNGWLYGCSATDGFRWAVVGGCWCAGIWRYVET